MSIRTTLIGIVSALVILVISYSSISFYHSYETSRVARETIQINDILNKLFDSADASFNAHGAVMLALSKAEPISESENQKIADMRKEADSLLDAAIAKIKTISNFYGMDVVFNEIKKNQEEVKEHWKKDDVALSQPLSIRDSHLGMPYFRAVTTLYASIKKLADLVNVYLYQEIPIDQLEKAKNYLSVITNNLSELRAHFLEILSLNKTLKKDEMQDLAEHLPVVMTMFSLLDGLFEGSILKSLIGEKYPNLKKSFEENYKSIAENIFNSDIKGVPYQVTADVWFEKSTLVISGLIHFSDYLNQIANNLAEEDNRKSLLYSIFASIALLFGFILAFFAVFVIIKRVVKPIAILQSNINAISAGDTSIHVDVSRNDEIGMIAKALNNLKDIVGKAFQLQQMVEEMPLSILVADPQKDFAISYGNKSSLTMMKTFEQFYGFKSSELIGTKIHQFHKNPDHQRQLLSNPNNLPYKKRTKIGNDWVDLQASAILDKNGKYISVMSAWNVVTTQVKLANDFESSVKDVVELVASSASQLKSSAEIMANNAEKTNHNSNIVAAASEQASANVQTVASAAEQLSHSIQEIARQVSQSTLICTKAVGQAKSTNTTIQFLANAVHKIGEVVNLITEIAGKTNLLALNATIEAARAGEAGRGFAVVASEVKDLANQTARATDEIAGQILSIQNSTNDAVKSIEIIGSVISELNDIATSISSAVDQQGAATKEIAMNVQQTAQGTQEVSSNIIEVSIAASETGNMASDVLIAADALTNQSSKLSEEVDRFLKEIKAA
ncbi:MAG: methyl-accepting chemotaxis protein [Alphaproteobacteria bacterium]|nr:methyl-accepting chemotaxis protein [Alphaproteobacteria bacterium]